MNRAKRNGEVATVATMAPIGTPSGWAGQESIVLAQAQVQAQATTLNRGTRGGGGSLEDEDESRGRYGYGGHAGQ
jgi:hypothetical protein